MSSASPVIHSRLTTSSGGDCFVYLHELTLLSPSNWLNTSLMDFYLYCLTNQGGSSSSSQNTSSSSSQNTFSFLEVSVASFIVNLEDGKGRSGFDAEDYADECANLRHLFASNKRMLLAVNSAFEGGEGWRNQGAGTHWSLLEVELDGAKGEARGR